MVKILKIKDFPGYYITENGEVYSCKQNLVKMKLIQSRNGYLRVWFRTPKHVSCMVHRLVAQAFIPNPDNKPQINHKNGIKTDNRVSNLEWATVKENVIHSIKHLKRNKKGTTKIVQQISNNKIIAEFPSIRQASIKTQINYDSIHNSCKNKAGYFLAGGYHWQYKNNT